MLSDPSASYLNALLELVPGRGRAFPEQLAEDDDLLKEENASFFGARQDAGVLLCHEEGFLLQQFALAGQFTLRVDTNNGQVLFKCISSKQAEGKMEATGRNRTSYPCSRPRFIMSLHSLGT